MAEHDLNETTLAYPVDAKAQELRLTSVEGVKKGHVLYLDGEATKVMADPLALSVRVMRGMEGSHAIAHDAGVAVYLGHPDLFHKTDPVGHAASDDTPWINTGDRRVWKVGDKATDKGPKSAARVWVLVEPAYLTNDGRRSVPAVTER